MREKDKGQVGLLILVVMGVLVALSLSVASRSLSDLLISRQEKEGTETFHVAEQGVEEALNEIRKSSGSVDGFSGTVDAGALVTGEYTIEEYEGLDIFVPEGDVVEVDLTGTTGVVAISWTLGAPDENPATCNDASGGAPAALEVIQLFGGSTPTNRSYYNPYNCNTLDTANSFTNIAAASGNEFRSRIEITPEVGATTMRLRPIYNGATIGVEGLAASQLYLIRSDAEGGDAEKEIEARRTKDMAAGIFDFAVFTNGTIVK